MKLFKSSQQKTSKEKEVNDPKDDNDTKEDSETVNNNTVAIDNKDNETNFFGKIAQLTSNLSNKVGNNIAATYNSAKNITGDVYNASINTISDAASSISDTTKQTFVTVKDKVGDSIASIEIKSNLYKLIDLIDVQLIAGALYAIPAPPPAKIGLVVVAQLLILIKENKKNKDNPDANKEEEIARLLKSVDLKAVIPILESYQKTIPFGKQVVFIVKLFIK